MPSPDFSWIDAPATQAVVAALGADTMRFVGGAVRDSLLGLPVHDIDIATVLRPDVVMERAQAAGLKAIPTGIDHGTVTLVSQHQPFEVTTLRQDISTDGRRAVVAFSDDWQADAARRDFTINALYLSSDRQMFDYFDGCADITARRVRFIGDAEQRIAEDALRILRFFRFSARYAVLPLDADGLAACIRRRRDMMALSRERLRDELLKILAAVNPLPVLHVMLEQRLFDAFLPEVASLEALVSLIDRENALACASAHRRFAALLPARATIMDDVAARFKFSNAERKRLVAAATRTAAESALMMRAAIYSYGTDTAIDRLLLGAPPQTDISPLFALAQNWRAPKLPVSGKHLIAAGVTPGPAVSAALVAFEHAWVAKDFPLDDASLTQLIKAAAARLRQTL
jgi:poly(A) polymerase